MYPYVMYLLYVAAVIGFCVLLLRREYRQRFVSSTPEPVEAALLRGGLGAVVETVIFQMHEKKYLELKTDGSGRKLFPEISDSRRIRLSRLEEASVLGFVAIQGSGPELKDARRQLAGSLRETEENMKKAGWWRTPARWHRVLEIMVPGLIVAGSLRFLNYYGGWLQWALALTVPVLAVVGRRAVRREMSGPTRKGKELLKQLQAGHVVDPNPLWQVALNGSQTLAGHPDYRLFCFMTRGLPYWKL